MHVLIIKHIENEDAGNIIDYLDDAGLIYRYVELYAGEALPEALDDVSHVIVMGGPMNVYEEDKYPFLADENVFIQRVLEKGLPFLGICLGGQLLAKALGAPVTKAPHREVGVMDVELITADKGSLGIFKALPEKFPTVQWHGDTFAIPEGGTLLARSKLCENQAFRIGESAYGLQFHPEVNEKLGNAWFDDVDPEFKEKIVKDFNEALPEYEKNARAIYREFF